MKKTVEAKVNHPKVNPKAMIEAKADKSVNLRQTLTRIVIKENLRNNEELIYFSC